jgi:hypothetical protein
MQGFGIALKLTFAGNNQLTHAPTYLFGFTVVLCILIQMVCRILEVCGRLLTSRCGAELLQQGAGYLLDERVSSPFHSLCRALTPIQRQPNLLRLLLNIDDSRVGHPLPGVQHDRRKRKRLPPLRVHGHLYGRLLAQYLAAARGVAAFCN